MIIHRGIVVGDDLARRSYFSDGCHSTGAGVISFSVHDFFPPGQFDLPADDVIVPSPAE